MTTIAFILCFILVVELLWKPRIVKASKDVTMSGYKKKYWFFGEPVLKTYSKSGIILFYYNTPEGRRYTRII